MAVWIEHDSHVRLGLDLRELGAEARGVGDGPIEIVDLNVEVHHRPLLARHGRLDRSDVVLSELEHHEHRFLGRLQNRGAGSSWTTGQSRSLE